MAGLQGIGIGISRTFAQVGGLPRLVRSFGVDGLFSLFGLCRLVCKGLVLTRYFIQRAWEKG